MAAVGVENGKMHESRALDDGETEEEEEWKDDIEVHYKVQDNPPFHLCLLMGFQHYITMFVATLTVPILLAPAICMDEDNVGKSQITGTLFVASGLITLVQNGVGCRLPVVQAGTFAILVPTLAYLQLDQWKCPSNIVSELPVNTTNNGSYIVVASAEHREVWMTRLREIQGAIMVAALLEVFLGASGAVGLLFRFIGPLSICPTVALLGLALFKSAATFAAKQWGIAWLTILLIITFSQFLGRFKIPCIAYTKEKGLHSQGYPVFKMFPIVLAILVTWFFCFLLTVTNTFDPVEGGWGHFARTDLRPEAITSSPWLRVPYPGQWGMPTVSIAAVCALISGILSTTVESIGDYMAYAKLSGAPPPPIHAINRGIMIEGLGSLLDGLLGTGNGTTSTSVNVGVVGLTKVGSRQVVQCSALFMIVFGVFTKFGALFITIPDPVIGGSFFILFSMIVAVGISNLQYVDMNSGRNLFVIGFSFFNGLALSEYVKANPSVISTGNMVVDNIIQVLLSTNMFVGGATGCILDNTIPGTDKERGFAQWKTMRKNMKRSKTSKYLREQLSAVYDLPYIMPFIRRVRCLRHVPFCPTYGQGEYYDEDTNNHCENHQMSVVEKL